MTPRPSPKGEGGLTPRPSPRGEGGLIPAHLTTRLATLPPGAICVGFSGGLDSTVLLDALQRVGSREVTAVHVHHGLSPNADAWADAASAFCAARAIPLAIERVEVDRRAPEGLEAAARAARYAVYAARPEPFVALAHHRDDQAETVLLQLLRGTGLRGVAAMPELRALNDRVSLLRPLLDLPRAALHEHAVSQGLAWVEDESNAGERHDRNYLRLAAAPVLDARFPNWRDALGRFARHAASADDLLETLARIDGLPEDSDAPLPLDSALDPRRRANLLRMYLAAQGLPMPSEARLAEIARQAYDAAGDARVSIDHGGARLVRHRGALHVEALEGVPGWEVPWHGEASLDLGAGRGEVTFEPAKGEGIAAHLATGEGWRVAPRAGGERMRLAPGRPTRTLKNLLQERGVPWWKRQDLPLLFHGARLVWIPGLGVAAEYACEASQPGLRPGLRVAGNASLC